MRVSSRGHMMERRRGPRRKGAQKHLTERNPATCYTHSGACEPPSAGPRGATTPCLVAEVVPSNTGGKYLLETPISLEDTKETKPYFNYENDINQSADL